MVTFQLRSESCLCSQFCNVISKSVVLLDGSQASPACPSVKTDIKLKMSMEHWWNGTDRGKLKYWERNFL